MKMSKKSCKIFHHLPSHLEFSNMKSMGATTSGMAETTNDVYRQRNLSEWVGKTKFHPKQCIPPKITPKMAKTTMRE